MVLSILLRSLLLSILLSVGAFADEPASDPVAVFVSLFGAELPNPGPEPEVLDELERQFHRQFPQRKVYKVTARDTEELRVKLSTLLMPLEEISHFWLGAHGMSSFTNPTNLTGEDGGAVMIINGRRERLDPKTKLIFRELPPLPLALAVPVLEGLHSRELEVFSGIRHRFANAAKVYLYSCSLFEGDIEQVASRARSVAFVLGLKNGEIFSHSGEFVAAPLVYEKTWRNQLMATWYFVRRKIFEKYFQDQGLIFRFQNGMLTKSFKSRSLYYWRHFFRGRTLRCEENL